MIVRAYQPSDADALAQIFFDAVRIGAASKYSAEQLAAWAPQRPTAQVWAARLAPLITFVATNPAPLGFMSLRADGYLDLAFVAPAMRGRGVADALHKAVLAHARSLHLRGLTTHASHMARSFFQRQGWKVTAAQTVTRHGHQLENFEMQLPLPQ